MLREQSRKAADRAEETMRSVRTVLDLTHDLGAVRRYFMATEEDRIQSSDLSGHPEWWDLPADQRAKMLREYWRNNMVPYDIPLTQESNRVFTSIEREVEEPFLTVKKKRVFVTTSRETDDGNKWKFEIPTKTYEIWVLLCWHQDLHLGAFVVPQKIFSQDFARVKKSLKKEDKISVLVSVDPRNNRFFLRFSDLVETQDITDLKNNYEPLR
jgi:tryptophanyl-tRNA synthetase